MSLATVLACGDDPAVGGDDSADGGSKDGGKKDASTTKDSGTGKDSGTTQDSGAVDSGNDEPDATLAEDASVPADAATEEDAAATDDAGSMQDAGASVDAGSDAGPVGPTVVGDLSLNEIFSNPPNPENNNEFLELKCKPGLSLAPYWLVIADGDRANNDVNLPGHVSFKKALTGTCGTGGFVVLQRGGVYDDVLGTTYANDFFVDNLQNGSQTYFLVETATFPLDDVDADNDGALDAAEWVAHVVDSLAMRDGTPGDQAYSPAVVDFAGDTAAFSRFQGATAIASSSWYFGAVVGSPFAYTAPRSGNFPLGGTLSPGQANSAP